MLITFKRICTRAAIIPLPFISPGTIPILMLFVIHVRLLVGARLCPDEFARTIPEFLRTGKPVEVRCRGRRISQGIEMPTPWETTSEVRVILFYYSTRCTDFFKDVLDLMMPPAPVGGPAPGIYYSRAKLRLSATCPRLRSGKCRSPGALGWVGGVVNFSCSELV